jgi:hypothetical protein
MRVIFLIFVRRRSQWIITALLLLNPSEFTVIVLASTRPGVRTFFFTFVVSMAVVIFSAFPLSRCNF